MEGGPSMHFVWPQTLVKMVHASHELDIELLFVGSLLDLQTHSQQSWHIAIIFSIYRRTVSRAGISQSSSQFPVSTT